MDRKLVSMVCFFTLLCCFSFGAFNYPSDYIKGAEITKDYKIEVSDILSHHTAGTWVAYNETFFTVDNPGPPHGYTRIHMFNWNHFGDSVASDPIIDYWGEHEWDYPFVYMVPAISMDYSEDDDLIYIAMNVIYWCKSCGCCRWEIVTWAFDPDEGCFVDGPDVLVNRSEGCTNPTRIQDVTVVCENKSSASPDNASYVYWTEYYEDEGDAHYKIQRRLIGSSTLTGDNSTWYQSLGTWTNVSRPFFYVDGEYDYQEDLTYIVVDSLGSSNARRVKAYKIVADASTTTDLGNISNSCCPTVDCYPWTKSTADFVVGFERLDGSGNNAGIGGAKYSGSSFYTPITLTTNTSARSPSTVSYTWGANSTQRASNTTEIVVWEQGSECRMARRLSSTVDTDIILAKQESGHPSSTDVNDKPLVASISRTAPNDSSSYDYGGFYAIWHKNLNTTSPQYIYGKHSSHSAPFASLSGDTTGKYRTNYDNGAFSSEQTGSSFTIDLEGMSGLTWDWHDGILKYETLSFPTGNQVYETIVDYKIDSITINEGQSSDAEVTVVCANDWSDGNIRNDPDINTHGSAGTYQTDATDVWNFWEKFPDGNNPYLGFYMPYGPFGYSEFESVINNTTTYTTYDCKYIKWINTATLADPYSCTEGSECKCAYEASCPDTFDPMQISGTTSDLVGCMSSVPGTTGNWVKIIVPASTTVYINLEDSIGNTVGMGIYEDCCQNPEDSDCDTGGDLTMSYQNSTSHEIRIWVLLNYHQCGDIDVTISGC